MKMVGQRVSEMYLHSILVNGRLLLHGIPMVPLLKDGVIITNTQQIDPMPVIIGAAVYPENLAEKLSASADTTAVEVTVSIKYKDTLPHYGKYEFTLNDRPEMVNKTYSSSGSYYLAWSATNDTIDMAFVDGEDFNYNQNP